MSTLNTTVAPPTYLRDPTPHRVISVHFHDLFRAAPCW